MIKVNFNKTVFASLLLCMLSPFAAQADGFKFSSEERIEHQVDSVFRKLSTREKIAQIMIIDMTSRDSKEMRKIQKRLVKKEKVGGLIPLGDVYRPAVERMNQLNKWAKIPMLMTIDAEWGVGMRWKEVPSHQFFIQLGALTSDSLVYEIGRSIADECRAFKFQVNYSPVVDINNNPDKFIVNFRTFGEDKDKVARYASAMMRGMRDGGLAGSAKHFPGHGETNVDSHLALPLLPFSAERLDSLELYPFRKLIADGVDMVMVGHLNVPALDPSGAPSSISKPIVTGLLREKMGYDGIIITDALNMYGVARDSGLEKKDIPLAAYKAGVDILLMPEDVENAISQIENALEAGEITMEGLDMRVKKMLRLKARYGIFDKSYDPIVRDLDIFTDTTAPDARMKAKLSLIKKVSEETMTVVFNDNSQGLGLPVSCEGKKVAYVGFMNPQLGEQFGEIANRYGQVDTVLLGDDAALEELRAAKEKVSGYDLVIFGFMAAAVMVLSCAAAAYAQESGKKALTAEEIVGKMPEGIVNQLPMVAGWKDANTLKLAQREGRSFKMFEYNVKSGEKVAVEAAPKALAPVAEAMARFMELPLAKEVKNPTLSPCGTKVAFTDKDNNLCVWNAASGEVAKLTSDGTNVIMNGFASWVYYEEILGRSSRYKAFWWSPDSKRIAYYKFDDSSISMFPIYDSRGKHGFITETRYPKAGDKNPEVKIAFVNIEDGSTVWADFDHTVDQYFGIPFWNADGSRFMIPWMPREQNNLVLYTVNPADGSKEPIYNENQSTWIDWMEDMQFVEDGFFMVRDFDMWEQIYFQSFDGKRLEKVTSGKNWGVRFVKVDMKEGYIYFTARREVSTRNDFYRVNLKSKKIERLSFGEYNFAGVQISPDNKFYVAQYSNSVTPTRLAVVDVKAAAKASSAKVAPKVPFEESKGVKVIGDSKGEKFDQYKLAIPQMLSITVDGYVLPAQVIWPVDLDSTKKYPVLVSMYGGPNAGTVMDTWKGISEKTQWWANEGVIQIAIDHRASGHCGKEGLNFLHRNLLNIELVDYIEWMKELHKLPFVNREKVGITGFSYGGSMTMLACTAGNDYFKYGIAGGGVYDWGLYDTHYTERYMDRPQDNPEGYANTQLFNKVARYKGDSTNYVKITHGSSDDNVHMQNTMQLIGALQDAGKQFDLMIYPGEFHGYRGKKSVHSTAGDYIFWYRHLLGKEAPSILK